MAEKKISPAIIILSVVAGIGGIAALGFMFAKAAPRAKILEVIWYDGATWHTFEDPLPSNVVVPLRVNISNNTDNDLNCKAGIYHEQLFPYWSYSDTFVIEPGEGYIDWEGWTGPAGIDTIIFRLFVDGAEVDSIEVTGTVV